jgi:hypothetical protein
LDRDEYLTGTKCHWDCLLPLDLRFRSSFGDMKLCFFVRLSAGCRTAMQIKTNVGC